MYGIYFHLCPEDGGNMFLANIDKNYKRRHHNSDDHCGHIIRCKNLKS
jgi:hypothetical protein